MFDSDDIDEMFEELAGQVGTENGDVPMIPLQRTAKISEHTGLMVEEVTKVVRLSSLPGPAGSQVVLDSMLWDVASVEQLDDDLAQITLTRNLD